VMYLLNLVLYCTEAPIEYLTLSCYGSSSARSPFWLILRASSLGVRFSYLLLGVFLFSTDLTGLMGDIGDLSLESRIGPYYATAAEITGWVSENIETPSTSYYLLSFLFLILAIPPAYAIFLEYLLIAGA